jgi:RNA polymerase sigma-70 factor (ECF subfamily)
VGEAADDVLLKQYQTANRNEILEQLLLRYRTRLFNFIYRLTHDHALSEDLLQELSLKVIKNIKRFRPERATSFRQWLYQIAINLCRDNARRRVPTNNMELEHVAAKTPDNRLEIEELIAGLPKEQKEVVLLKVYSGLTFREIAETLKCPLNTAISRMHYALKTLREKAQVYDKV